MAGKRHEHPRRALKRAKSEGGIELPRGIVDRIDRDRPHRDVFRRNHGALDCIRQQDAAQSAPYDISVYGQTADERGGHRLARQSSREFYWQIAWSDDGGTQGKIAKNPPRPFGLDGDVDACDTAPQILPGLALEIAIECLYPAGKSTSIVSVR
jgi:hypothetical protein